MAASPDGAPVTGQKDNRSYGLPAPGRAPCILVTGFGPFPGAPYNPTGDLVRALCNLRRPAFAAVRRVPYVFRTSYAAVDADLPRLIADHRPDAILMFGLAAKAKFVRIETTARNARSVVFADNAGRQPSGGAIDPHGPMRIGGRAPFRRILAAARGGRVAARLSDNAGRYLCNYLYWRALALNGPHAPRIVVFVHIPLTLRLGVRRRAGTAPEISAQDLARMADAVLRVVVSATRRTGLGPLS